MGKTSLTNNVKINVQVKEGNANIFRILQVLKQGESMTIQADSKATYREYVLILLPDNTKLRSLSSDDIEEFDAIEIFQDDETKEYDWRELRIGAVRKSWFGGVLGWFHRNSGAKADSEADATVEASAGSSKSPTAAQ